MNEIRFREVSSPVNKRSEINDGEVTILIFAYDMSIRIYSYGTELEKGLAL
ncbi:MAG: hypothetical protein KGL31_12060 [candidate division NC10 bacterium]|nr:hypothetical protein [candidate division NC10 bacterium]MDE2322626.1 hypothetical protein [candidate division NC10 bacterium]